MSRVVVLGAGMGGLAVAVRMAAQGHDVTVLERSGTHGGKVARVERDGFVVDTGPSLLTLPAVYRDLFLSTAVSRRDAALEDNVGLLPVDPAFAYEFADGTRVEVPDASRAGTRDVLDDVLGGGAGAQWTSLVDHASHVWKVTRGPFLSSPAPSRAALLRLATNVRDLRAVAPFTTLRELGRRFLRDARLQTMLDRYATYAGSDPRRAPAALCVIPYVEQTFGVWHVQGGFGELADALARRCTQHGVSFRFDATVTAVSVGGGRVDGVRLQDGEHVPADVVVSDVDARHLYADLLPGAAAGRARSALDRTTPSSSGLSLQLALAGRTPSLRHHTVLFPADYDAEFDALFARTPRAVADPAVYVCAPDDPRMRPDDGEAWCVLVNAPPHARGDASPAAGVDWSRADLVQDNADRLLASLARRGLDVRDRIVWSTVRTPADIEHDSGSPGGSIYGPSSNGARAAFRRPGNVGPVPGLFLVGGSAHPGGGLPLVGISAEIVAGLVGTA